MKALLQTAHGPLTVDVPSWMDFTVFTQDILTNGYWADGASKQDKIGPGAIYRVTLIPPQPQG